MSNVSRTSFKLLIIVFGIFLPISTIKALSAASIRMEESLGDIAVVGCGVLGTSVCRQLMQERPALFTSITGITRTTTHHENIRKEVLTADNLVHQEKFILATVDEIRQANKKYNNVIFCAPPSGSVDYTKDVEEAVTKFWIGPGNPSSLCRNFFLFTSSGAVYSSEAQVVTESSQVDDINPRATRLLQAENACLSHSGAVLRLAGLYNLERGPHSFWLRSSKTVQGRPDGIINMLHYDDAARACISALLVEAPDDVHRKVFLISDGNPITRKDICLSSLQHDIYSSSPDCSMPKFISTENDPVGKSFDGSWSQRVLKWKPLHPSFRRFMNSAESNIATVSKEK